MLSSEDAKRREERLAELVYGPMTPQEIAAHVKRIRAEALEEGARTGGRTPLWAVGLAIFTPVYIYAGVLSGVASTCSTPASRSGCGCLDGFGSA